MAVITGRVEITVNGTPLLNKAGAKASGIGISGARNFEMKPVNGDTGLHGFVEEPINAELEVTVSDSDNVLLSDLAKINGDGSVTFMGVNSKKAFTMEGATCTRNFELTAGEGETTVRFVGNYWNEVELT